MSLCQVLRTLAPSTRCRAGEPYGVESRLRLWSVLRSRRPPVGKRLSNRSSLPWTEASLRLHLQERPWDLYIAAGYTLIIATVLVATTIGSFWAILFLLFVPGYALVAALFPRA